jgi:hypothetical protein
VWIRCDMCILEVDTILMATFTLVCIDLRGKGSRAVVTLAVVTLSVYNRWKCSVPSSSRKSLSISPKKPFNIPSSSAITIVAYIGGQPNPHLPFNHQTKLTCLGGPRHLYNRHFFSLPSRLGCCGPSAKRLATTL